MSLFWCSMNIEVLCYNWFEISLLIVVSRESIFIWDSWTWWECISLVVTSLVSTLILSLSTESLAYETGWLLLWLNILSLANETSWLLLWLNILLANETSWLLWLGSKGSLVTWSWCEFLWTIKSWGIERTYNANYKKKLVKFSMDLLDEELTSVIGLGWSNILCWSVIGVSLF